MAEDFGGAHDALTSTLPHDISEHPTILHPEKPSRQSTMWSKGGIEVHTSGTTTPSSYLGGNRAGKHVIEFDEYFVRFSPSLSSPSPLLFWLEM